MSELGYKRLLLFLAGIFLAYGAFYVSLEKVYYQTRAMKTFVPVEAKVVDKNINISRSAGENAGTYYDFLVTYRYFVDGHQYSYDKIGPLGKVGSSRETKIVYSQYQKDQTITAYYNPENPSQAFLIHYFSSGPYLTFLVFTAVLYLVIIAFSEMGIYQRKREMFYNPDKETFCWLPEIGVGINFWKYVGVFALWNLCGLLAGWHYLSFVGQEYSVWAVGVMAGYELTGLSGLFAVYWYKRIFKSSKIEKVN